MKKKLKKIEPRAKTFKNAIWSPSTASIDPQEILKKLQEIAEQQNINIHFNSCYLKVLSKNNIITNKGNWHYGYLINAAGLYADKLARDFGFAKNYTILPFKGLYLQSKKLKEPLRTHLYPVPYKKQPFLGVHLSRKINGKVSLGPTALPVWSREGYKFWQISIKEFLPILFYQTKLFWFNKFDFRLLIYNELKKCRKKH